MLFILSFFTGTFGENKRGRMTCGLVTTPQALGKRCAAPTYVSRQILSDNMAMVFNRQRKICLNSAICVSFAILELSKLEMQEAWYDIFKPAFGEDMQLIFTDTVLLFSLISCRLAM